jgi:hypothetical protein
MAKEGLKTLTYAYKEMPYDDFHNYLSQCDNDIETPEFRTFL